MKSQNLVKALIGLNLVGLLNAAYTLFHRQSLLAKGLPETSFCSVNAYINCDAVALSPESALFFGYPTSAFGVIVYVVLLVLTAFLYFAQQDKKHEEEIGSLASGIWILSVVSLVPTLLLAGISFFRLQMLCPMCVLTYIINIVLTVMAFSLRRKHKAGGLKTLPRNAVVAASIAALIALPSPWIASQAAGGADKATVDAVLYSHYTAGAKSFRVDNSPSMGSPDAPVTLVEFSDFQCPFCAQASNLTPEIVRAYPGKVRVVFKNYPLDSTCNRNMDRPAHPMACQAAKAARCVFRLKGNEAFFAYKKEVFAVQSRLSSPLLEELAEKIGLPKADLVTCMADVATHQEVAADVAEGEAAGVNSTPSLYVNGRLLRSATQPIILRKVIDGYLGQAKPSTP